MLSPVELDELVHRVVAHEGLPDKQHQVGLIHVDQVAQCAHEGLVVLQTNGDNTQALSSE